MNTQTHKREIRVSLRQRQLRRHYIKLTVKERLPSADAIRLMAPKYGLSEARLFAIVRPADVRALLADDWDGTMKLHSLDIPRPVKIEIDPLEGGEA